MRRDVEPELLDALPPGDPRAIQARQDLRTVNSVMGTARIMARQLVTAFAGRAPASLAEVGAGDGTLLLRVAKLLAPRWAGIRVALVDQQGLVSSDTRSAFAALSWRVETVQTDVFEWLDRPGAPVSDAIVANLFLHHFEEDNLRRLLRGVSRQARCFLACEPRRNRFSLRAAGLLWMLGCNDVTRHDARASVQAGFRNLELSALWPARDGWRLSERAEGRFSHCFIAQRVPMARS